MRLTTRYLLPALVGFVLGLATSPTYLCTVGSPGLDVEQEAVWRPREPLRGSRTVGEGGRDCVCGEELSELKKLSKVNPISSPCVKERPPPTAQPMNDAQQREFMYPSNKTDTKGKRFRPGSSHEPKSLQDEYLFKKTLFVGVLTQQAYLPTRAKYLYETWGREVDKLVFFVGEDCIVPANLKYLPIVKLPGIPDNVYPPLRKTFAVLQYMYENHLGQFKWFIRADDDMYVRVRKLKELLTGMVSEEKVYLGRAGTGRRDDLDRLALLPHERYCMGGPGIFLSSSALQELGPHLANCLNAGMESYPSNTENEGGLPSNCHLCDVIDSHRRLVSVAIQDISDLLK